MLNDIKVEKVVQVVSLLVIVSDEKVQFVLGVVLSDVDVVLVFVFVIVDFVVVVILGEFFIGEIVDLCNIEVGDLFLDGKGIIEIKCGIEVGYIF